MSIAEESNPGKSLNSPQYEEIDLSDLGYVDGELRSLRLRAGEFSLLALSIVLGSTLIYGFWLGQDLGATEASMRITRVTLHKTPGSNAELGNYVASKKGIKYHLPWCPGAKQISSKNKIWFASKEEAQLAGYQPASNCKGL